MEPENLNSSAEREAELEAWLRSANPPLPDAGFSARVVAALPAKPRASHSRLWCCLGGLIAGVIVAVTRGLSFSSLREGTTELHVDLPNLETLAGNPWITVTVVLIAASLIYALKRHDSGSIRT